MGMGRTQFLLGIIIIIMNIYNVPKLTYKAQSTYKNKLHTCTQIMTDITTSQSII